jgi:hypothetical protein
MKKMKYILILGFAVFLTATPGFAQEKAAAPAKDFKFTIKTNPLSALGGPLWAIVVPLTAEYKVYFEAKTLSSQSIQLGLGYLGTSPLIKSIGDIGGDTSINASGFHGQIWYKFFLTSDKAPGGFYIGPHFSYATAKVKNTVVTDNFIKASKLNIHCVFGYQVITKGGFALDIYTGLGFKRRTYDLTNIAGSNVFTDLEIKDKSAVSVPFGLTFGYAF